ncbi:MAG: hypothetical protein LBD42_00305 [Desulfovibrio sp.]|jgi:hypothetical protein|nr:hypothetical protein [Desulfovibrio sp.]
MAEVIRNAVEIQTARQGVSGRTTQNNQIVVSGPYMEILIGGPYIKKSGEESSYGHVALRVVVDKKDTTYDFGRYGKVWGTFDSQGEGILRIWSSFISYIRRENALDRQTVGFVYPLKQAEAQRINSHFKTLIAGAQKCPTQVKFQQVYKLVTDYHPTNNNCTTISIDGALTSGKQIMHNAASHSKRRGLTNLEGAAAKLEDWPSHKIFMPADLQAVLEANTVCPCAKKNTYPQ